MNGLSFSRIKAKDAHELILTRHYAKRIPSISYAFGLWEDERLVGVVTFGQPASPWISVSLTGERNRVIELNRLVIDGNAKNYASQLIGFALRSLTPGTIVVSYADEAQNHKGYVYQATNWFYGGCSKPRTDMDAGEGKHARHHLGDRTKRVFRSAKHRYWIVTGKNWRKSALSLKWTPMAYPKATDHIDLVKEAA